MKKASVLLIALLILAMILSLAKAEENPGPWWVKTYGGRGDDWAGAVAVAENGDIIVTGSFTMRLDANGNVIRPVKINDTPVMFVRMKEPLFKLGIERGRAGA